MHRGFAQTHKHKFLFTNWTRYHKLGYVMFCFYIIKWPLKTFHIHFKKSLNKFIHKTATIQKFRLFDTQTVLNETATQNPFKHVHLQCGRDHNRRYAKASVLLFIQFDSFTVSYRQPTCDRKNLWKQHSTSIEKLRLFFWKRNEKCRNQRIHCFLLFLFYRTNERIEYAICFVRLRRHCRIHVDLMILIFTSVENAAENKLFG